MQSTAEARYMTVKQWVSTFGFIPEGGLRHLIFTNKDFERRVVKRLGRKIILDVQELNLWLSEQTATTGDR
jgi:hypothetical protein